MALRCSVFEAFGAERGMRATELAVRNLQVRQRDEVADYHRQSAHKIQDMFMKL